MVNNYNAIRDHLRVCSESFEPSLDSYVDIDTYAKKIADKAVVFGEFEQNSNKLKGMIAAYDNASEKLAWITNVSVDPDYMGEGLASKLLESCVDCFRKKQYNRVVLEVFTDNKRAIRFYKKHKFKVHDMKEDKLTLEIDLKKEQRNYDEELKDTHDHKYAYNFDFDVMHPYYMKSALPYLDINIESSCLELGSSKGHFTRQILKHFNNVTCVEASQTAIEDAKTLLNKSEYVFDKDWRNKEITYHNSLFENVKLSDNLYDTIFLTHVLEHIQDPVSLLRQVNGLLSKSGSFILICPNANAPSRQIAVKMGLIPHATAVTESETKHGHYRTYTLDTLEADARMAGLEVVARTGVFFKGLANFQWDMLIKSDIVSKEYLDGCFALGQQYPDLCSSIMLICKKGN